MKNLIVGIVAFVLTFAIALNSFSQDKQKVVEVTGNATIEVQPDIMNWEIRVQDDSNDLQSAKNNNEASTGKILSMLKEYGVKEEKISTSGLRFTKNYYYDAKSKKYSVTNTVWFSTSDFSIYDKVSDFSVTMDNVFINNTVLSSSKEIETRKQARVNALKAAKEKAEMMAAVYGKVIGDPIMISEEYSSPYFSAQLNNVMSMDENQRSGDLSTFSKGVITISARVKVVFELK